jgi:superfamily II DNA or RNA helicase
MTSTPKKKPAAVKKAVTHKSSQQKPLKLKVSKLHKPEDLGLEEWQRLLRKEYGQQQNFRLENRGDHPIFSDFSLTNFQTGKTYKIAIRGKLPGDNFCSCPDYSGNNLGTCKHIEFTLSQLMKKRGAVKAFTKGHSFPYSEIYLHYGLKREIRFKAGKGAPVGLLSLAKKYFDGSSALKAGHFLDFHEFLAALPRDNAHELRCYDDVMAYVAEHQDAEHRRAIVGTCLKDGIDSPLFDTVLKTPLYPYQREGALFAVTAGRCLIGDDMGLGKTIQALTAAELMAELFGVQKVLIVSPTSLKYQWKGEIEKFTERSAEIIEGLNHQRKPLYENDSFYKLVNYELVARDLEQVRAWAPDLIILDEAQRIKNWQTRTAKTVKQLESTFAIVLTGTPIENRIEELHSIMEFVDRHHLGPLYRFVHDHRITDEGGKVVGYRNLEAIRKSLHGVMIRRKKDEVLKQLPGRVDKNFFVPMTPEQQAIHDEQYDIVVKLVAKWRRFKFLCEADQRRMQIALAYMRMAADNTYLVDKKTVFGPKIEELEIILKELVVEGGEKVVIFSQWLRMTELVEGVLNRNGISYVHLNGSVPSKGRKVLMTRFKEEPDCMVFLSTDAGGVGLNLQSGSVVINMDIPWNPAILEQRIARVHRLGQKRSVNVINFISRGSIEERILDLLRFKKSLFAGALDSDGEDVVMIGDSQLKKFMESVETVTENLEKKDPAQERQEQLELELEATAAAKEELAERVDGPAAGVDASVQLPDPLQHLLAVGAQFLMNLSQAVAQPNRESPAKTAGPGEPPAHSLSSLVGRDEVTGKGFLKIPLPEPELLNTVISGLGQLLAGALKK